MTGPERHVLRAAAALMLEAIDGNRDAHAQRGAAVEDVAELSKYPDLDDRRHVVSLERRGYVKTWTAKPHTWGAHKRVSLTAKGWLDVLESR